MCVSLTYKDKLQDNYSIFNEFLMNYTQIVSFKFQENGQRLSSEGLIVGPDIESKFHQGSDGNCQT